LQLVHEKAGNTLETIGISKDFLSRAPSAQQPRERMDKLDYMKLKSFCTTIRDYLQSGRKYLLAIYQTKD
jgi:hypothetical protein